MVPSWFEFVLSGADMLSFPAIPIQVTLVVLVVVAGIFDLRFRRIPNWLTVSGFLAGIGLNTLLHGVTGLLFALGGAALAFALYFLLYLARGMGAGDVKLMTAVGAMAGPFNWLGVLFLTAIFGGAIGLILVTVKGRLRRTFSNLGYLLKQLVMGQLPYARREELDVGSGKAVGLPHGAVVTLGVIAFLAAAWTWAPR